MEFSASDQVVRVNVDGPRSLTNIVRYKLQREQGFAVATLNLDHIVKLHRSAAFSHAYAQHDFVVADGRPIVWLARLGGQRLRLAPGSDMIDPLCRVASQTGRGVALVGSSDDVLDKAAQSLVAKHPGLLIVYRRAPSRNFDPSGDEAAEILQELSASGAGLCMLALGAPKQEIFAAHARDLAPNVGFISIGAGLDFISGHQIRAPMILRLLALEWLWRMVCSPMRMVPRYAKCFAVLPRLAWDAVRQQV